MTAMADCCRSAYLYAQSLDNSGDASCWRIRSLGEYQEVDCEERERTAVLHAIDYVQNSGRKWLLGNESLECMVTYRGDCLVSIKPLTRDAGGRLAPVTLIFNVFGDHRESAARALNDCETLTRRELSAEHHVAIGDFEKIMRWPSIFIALHILVCSRGRGND